MHPTRFTVAPRFRPALSAREGEGRRARLPRDRRCTVPSVPSRSVPTPPPPQRGAAAPARAVTYMAGGVRVRPRCRPRAPVRSEVVGMNRTHRMQNKTKRKKKKRRGEEVKEALGNGQLKPTERLMGEKKKKKKTRSRDWGTLVSAARSQQSRGCSRAPLPPGPAAVQRGSRRGRVCALGTERSSGPPSARPRLCLTAGTRAPLTARPDGPGARGGSAGPARSPVLSAGRPRVAISVQYTANYAYEN